jgi:glycosyltransferase involved in cell wall biosynthesis
MKLSLIICTLNRPVSTCGLLDSITNQVIIPNEILIIDASVNDQTYEAILKRGYNLPLKYYRVQDEYRGLTRQRNYGVSAVGVDIDIVAFLDDDIKLEPDYFLKLLHTYSIYDDAIGAGGIDLFDNKYIRNKDGIKHNRFNYYELDGWVLKEPLRNKARKLFGLMPDLQPGLIPEYSHGRSTLPPSGIVYEVEHLMGGIASYKRELFDKIQFSNFFSGYSLYEDFDFSVRALNYGKLYVNTNAKVWHYHAPSGRPNFFKYGRMVVRNGWYVWRVRYPAPTFKAKLKWHAVTMLLAHIRLANAMTGPGRRNALMDYLGRMLAWVGVCIKPPVFQNY